MKKLIFAGAMSAFALLVSACGDGADETVEDTDVVATDVDTPEPAAAGGSADWPAGTRIVEEDGVTYRVDPDGTRLAIEDGSWRIETDGDRRFRVADDGTRVEIDDDGLDFPVDVDIGTNTQGNLDVDVSTDGSDASDDQVRETR